MNKFRQVSGGPRFQRKSATDRRRQLIDAATTCLGEGGVGGFTIDRICREANVSRGLINHHFQSKDALLSAVYGSLTRYMAATPAGGNKGGDPATRLIGVVESSFAAHTFNKTQLRAWLALWGEITTNDGMRKIHEDRYSVYFSTIETAIEDVAAARGREVDSTALAQTLIALIDGLWLQWCLNPAVMSLESARAACYGVLEPHLGPVKPDRT